MKAICTISHQQPLGDGKFAVYEAGGEYEINGPLEPYFMKVRENGKKREEAKSDDNHEKRME